MLCIMSGTVLCAAMNRNMQALWLVKEDTWEPASSLHQAVVGEFQKGMECAAMQQKNDFYGQKKTVPYMSRLRP